MWMHSKNQGEQRGSKLPRSGALALTAAGLLLASLPVYAKKTPKIPVQTAVIENTGSTNTRGYRIILDRIGDVSATAEVQYPGSTTDGLGDFVPLKLYEKLFKDLDAAMPLTSLPVRHGMRSASFGTRTYITYKGQKSPDLTFASDPRTAALKADIDAITKALHVGNAPRHPVVTDKDGAITDGIKN